MLGTKLINISKIVFENGRTTLLEFYYNKERYSVIITPSEVNISRVGIYNRKTKDISWYIRHCCGEQGYDPFLGDRCAACESGGITKDIITARVYGNYTPEFPKVFNDINKYCENLECVINKLISTG